MSTSANKMTVFALIRGNYQNVSYAKHPEQANNPHYKPPFQNLIPDPDRENYSLQKVGSAALQEDGTILVNLSDTPLSKTLIIRSSQE